MAVIPLCAGAATAMRAAMTARPRALGLAFQPTVDIDNVVADNHSWHLFSLEGEVLEGEVDVCLSVHGTTAFADCLEGLTGRQRSAGKPPVAELIPRGAHRAPRSGSSSCARSFLRDLRGVPRGMSRANVKEFGEVIDDGSAALVVVGESKIEEAVDKAALKAEKHVAKELDVKPSDIDAAVREAVSEVS